MKDVHFYGIQVVEDFLSGNLTAKQFEEIMNLIEVSVFRYLGLIQEARKFSVDIKKEVLYG